MNEFGVGTYTRNIVRALARLDHENEYLLLGPEQKVHEIGALPSNFQSIAVPPSDTPKGYWEGHTVVRRQGCELVHVPYLFWPPRYFSALRRQDQPAQKHRANHRGVCRAQG